MAYNAAFDSISVMSQWSVQLPMLSHITIVETIHSGVLEKRKCLSLVFSPFLTFSILSNTTGQIHQNITILRSLYWLEYFNPFPNTTFWDRPKFKEAADNNIKAICILQKYPIRFKTSFTALNNPIVF